MGAGAQGNALFDAHREDLEFGYRFLVEEAREIGGQVMADRTAWRICLANGWGSVFGKPKAYSKARRAGRRRTRISWPATSPPPTTTDGARRLTPIEYETIMTHTAAQAA